MLFVNTAYRNKQRALLTAKRLGLSVAVVGPEIPEWARAHVDRHIRANTYDIEETLRALRPEHKRSAFDGVITFWDRDVEVVAHVAAELGLPGSPIEAASTARNKHRCREVLHSHGVPQPAFARFTTWEELQAASGKIGFPLICKPLGASGSKGVFKVNGPWELPGVYEQLRATVRPELDAMFSFHPGQYVAEEFMTGSEVSVEGIVCEGVIHCVGITEKWTTDDYFTEYQHAFPARVPEGVASAVRSLAHSAVRALGLDNCGFHVEVMIGREGPRIVEVNGRLGGDLITTHLVPIASGVDLVEAALLTALGQTPRFDQRRKAGACVRYLLATSGGRVASWNRSRVSELPGVVEFVLEKVPGDAVILPPARFADHRLCYAVAEGVDTAEAIRNVNAALAGVACVIE